MKEVKLVLKMLILLLSCATSAASSLFFFLIILNLFAYQLFEIKELCLKVTQLLIINEYFLPLEIIDGLNGLLIMPDRPNEIQALIRHVSPRLTVLI